MDRITAAAVLVVVRECTHHGDRTNFAVPVEVVIRLFVLDNLNVVPQPTINNATCVSLQLLFAWRCFGWLAEMKFDCRTTRD